MNVKCIGKSLGIDEPHVPLLSIALGIFIGLSTVGFSLLFKLISMITKVLENCSLPLHLLLPMIGITLSSLLVYKFSYDKRTGCGTHKVLEAYNFQSGFIPLRDTFTKTVASALTIGCGGSAGLEGPSLLLGGGLASWISDKLKLKPQKVRTLLLVGSAAGLSAIFKAPLTAIFFAIEIPYKRDLEKEMFIPALLSAVPAYLITISLLGGESIFTIPQIQFTISMELLWLTIFEGLIAGLTAIIFIKFFEFFGSVRTMLRQHKTQFWVISLMGGAIISVIWCIIPEAVGIGYEVISRSLSREFLSTPLLYVAAILLAKMIATAVTLNFGGSGGIFIPSIFVGAILGTLMNKISPTLTPHPEILIVAGMAALMAAANKTLFSSIAFVAETCGPSSIIPVTLAASISYFTSGKFSFYGNVQLPRKMEEEERALEEVYHIIKEHPTTSVLNVKVKDVMTPNPIYLRENMTIEEALDKTKNLKFRVYPVVDDKDRIVGYIKMEDLLSILEYKRKLKISSITLGRPLIVKNDDRLIDVVEKMCEYEVDHAYVVSDMENMKLIGVVSSIDAIRAILDRLKS